jgi:hypothetical protein
MSFPPRHPFTSRDDREDGDGVKNYCTTVGASPESPFGTSAIAEDVGAVNREVQDRIDGLTLPPGVDEVEMGGVAESMRESFSAMYIAIGIAVVIAYVVMVFF